MQNRNKQSEQISSIVLLVIILLLCLSYAISVVGRIGTLYINMPAELSTSSKLLSKPDKIFITSPINKKDFSGYVTDNRNESNTSENSKNDTNVNSNVIGNTIATDEPGFWISDRQIWETEAVLRIFENPIYNFAERIAPDSGNSYAFNLINNNEFTVKCDIEFLENNIHNINMKYRLKQNGDYICGNDNTWVSYAELKARNAILNSNEIMPYILEWKWFDSDNDTELGQMDNIQYSLSIHIYTEQISE